MNKPAKNKSSKKQREREDYEKWLRSLEKLAPNFARKAHPKQSSVLEYKLTTPPGRSLAVGKSVVTVGGSTAMKNNKQYTGTAMLGVGMLHKSNLVPVFATEDAKDLASMRR